MEDLSKQTMKSEIVIKAKENTDVLFPYCPRLVSDLQIPSYIFTHWTKVSLPNPWLFGVYEVFISNPHFVFKAFMHRPLFLQKQISDWKGEWTHGLAVNSFFVANWKMILYGAKSRTLRNKVLEEDQLTEENKWFRLFALFGLYNWNRTKPRLK